MAFTTTLEAAEATAVLLYQMATSERPVDPTVFYSDGRGTTDPTAYGHVQRALLALLEALTGTEEGAQRVYELIIDNGESVQWNLRHWAQEGLTAQQLKILQGEF